MSTHSDALTHGLRYHQRGQLDQAQQIYRDVVAADPANADAWSLLGAVCINLDRLDEAYAHLTEALRLNSQHHAAHDNLGVLLARQARFADAIASFHRALEIQPHQASTYMNLASALERNGQPAEAIEALRKAAQLAPDTLRAHTELLRLLAPQGRLGEAVDSLRAIGRLQPADPRAQFESAAALAQIGRVDEAMAGYRETLRLKPDTAEAMVNLGSLHSQRGELDEAVSLFRQALQLRPRFAEAYTNLGRALTRQGKLVEAATALEEAIRLKPELSEAHNNLGVARADDAHYAQAVDCYRQALALNPDNVDALYNLGIAHLMQRMVATALDCFEQVLDRQPNRAEARHNRSAALLLSENFAEGFVEYEWRFRLPNFPGHKPRWPVWDGGSLAGKTIVLCDEQGLGDTIQFVRYATLVRERADRVIVECPRALHAILARIAGVDEWIATGQPAPPADCCISFLSLPHRLGTTHATIPAHVPYVFADPQLVETWKTRLAGYEGFKIGVAWQGNPNCPGDRFRSIPLARFVPLAALSGVRLISLQKGPGEDQLAELADAWNLVNIGDALDAEAGAFMDTAAIMKNLDLVVTSDSAVAHLAGALGVPVWVALPYVPDWRWMLDREDNPWYPTMRLFRQEAWGEWHDVFDRMAAEVKAIADAPKAAQS